MSTSEGRALFKEAIAGGANDIYFPLAEVLNTQAHPAYCGITSLAVVLNALLIDPKRTWKGVWRWWSEEMLDCCTPLEKIQMKGITLGKLNCLAECQGAKSEMVYGTDITLEDFRESIVESCGSLDSSTTKIIIVSYSRPALNQTGSGHFSPIGAYHVEKTWSWCSMWRVSSCRHIGCLSKPACSHGPRRFNSGKPRGFLTVSSPRSWTDAAPAKIAPHGRRRGE